MTLTAAPAFAMSPDRDSVAGTAGTAKPGGPGGGGGNPGPAQSSFWPVGQTTPRACSAASPDTADCAYDYGWNAAQHSYQTVEAAYAARGITANPNATDSRRSRRDCRSG